MCFDGTLLLCIFPSVRMYTSDNWYFDALTCAYVSAGMMAEEQERRLNVRLRGGKEGSRKSLLFCCIAIDVYLLH